MTIGTKDPLMQRFVKAVRRLRAYSSVGTPGPTQLVPVISASGTEAIGSMALSDIVTQSGIASLLSGAPFIRVNADVAAVGTNLATAAQLLTGFTVVTGADGSVGVKLPATPAAGSIVIIKGTTAGVLKVYPDAAATINAIGSNAAMSLASGVIPAIFIAKSTTQWYTLPLLPS